MCPVMERFPLLWKLRKDFDAQHLEKGLNRGGQIFGAFFFKKVPLFANIGRKIRKN